MKKFYLRCDVSKKSGNRYVALFVDFGYRSAALTFDTVLILELTGLTSAELYALQPGEVRPVDIT